MFLGLSIPSVVGMSLSLNIWSQTKSGGKTLGMMLKYNLWHVYVKGHYMNKTIVEAIFIVLLIWRLRFVNLIPCKKPNKISRWMPITTKVPIAPSFGVEPGEVSWRIPGMMAISDKTDRRTSTAIIVKNFHCILNLSMIDFVKGAFIQFKPLQRESQWSLINSFACLLKWTNWNQ